MFIYLNLCYVIALINNYLICSHLVNKFIKYFHLRHSSSKHWSD